MADKKLCFVIGPIGAAGSEARTHADWLLNGIIRPVMNEHFPDFEVQRADEIKAPGDINSQIINRLMDAALVIADMSMHNANAFYELAIRHMVRLPTIHVTHVDWKIPFDVAPYRAIHFSRLEFSHIETARAELFSVVKEVIMPGFVVENPITHARARFEIDSHATPAVQALAAEVTSLRERIAQNESEVAKMEIINALRRRPAPTWPESLAAAQSGNTLAAETVAGLLGPESGHSARAIDRLFARTEPSAFNRLLADTQPTPPVRKRKKD